MRYLAVIPARGGSKGIPRKNVRDLLGKPLIAWSIEQALASERIDVAIVSTDDEEIADVSRRYGARVPFFRPLELAQDSSPTEPSIIHAVEFMREIGECFDAVVILQPTSPLRLPHSIDAAIELFETSNANSLVGVCENHHFFWTNKDKPRALYDYKNRPRRQDILPSERWYRENGSIYITKTEALLEFKNRLCEPIAMYLMAENEGWEIDSEVDFKVLECLLEDR